MKKGAVVAGIAAWLSLAASAAAQSIDYGALEQLFGEPVTTSVTGSPQRVSDVPATMEIITADEIRRSGARDIPGVLRHVAGLDVQQWTNDQADVGVRGYDQPYSPRLLVLVDGRQVYADWYGFTPWSTLPVELSDIRQIEVVKGPQSALFGFNAVGGVINIITYNPLYDDINTASLTAGTQSLAQGSAVATTKLGDLGALRISAGGRADADFSTPAGLPFIGTRRGDNRGAIDLDGVFRLRPATTLGIEASHVTADQSEINVGLIPDYAQYAANSVKAHLTSDTDTGVWQATAYTNWFTTHYLFGLTQPLPSLVFNNRVTVVQVQDLLKIGPNHTLRGAVEFRNNTEGTAAFDAAVVSYDVIAADGMWQWQIVPSLSLTNALRVDHLMLSRSGAVPAGYPLSNSDWNRSITVESFNSGVVWKADSEDTVRILASRGVQLPNLAELGALLLVQTPVGNFTGVPTVQPTTVANYEIAWDRELPAVAAQLRFAAYHQSSHDIAGLSGSFVAGPGGLYFTPANVANSLANGFELAAKGRLLSHWRWGLSYTPEVIRDHFVPGLTNLTTTTDFQHTTPLHVVNANLGWSKGRWEIDGFARYESRFFGFMPVIGAQLQSLVPIEDYVALDGRIGYRLTDRVTLALSGQNLSRASQHQTSGPAVERRILGTVSVKF